MSVALITGHTGENHVTADSVGAANAAIYGSGKYALNVFEKFSYEIVSNNLIKVKSGIGLDQGRFFEIPLNDTVEFTIENGTQGSNFRMDIIGFQYEKDITTGIESITPKVIKGTTGTTIHVPSYTEGNLLNGDTSDFFPLYKVLLGGLSIGSVTPAFEVLSGIPDLKAFAERKKETFTTLFDGSAYAYKNNVIFSGKEDLLSLYDGFYITYLDNGFPTTVYMPSYYPTCKLKSSSSDEVGNVHMCNAGIYIEKSSIKCITCLYVNWTGKTTSNTTYGEASKPGGGINIKKIVGVKHGE